MIWKQFTHLEHFPPKLKARFNSFLTTEFDDSLSVEMQLRSVIKWCQGNFKTVDTLIDFINDISNWLKQFETNFDTKLEDTVISVLSEWQASGKLDDIINDVLQWQLDDYIATNEQDKVSLTAQLQQKAESGDLQGIQTQVNNLVVGSGTSSAEIVQARDTEQVLSDRLKKIEDAERIDFSKSADIKYGAKRYLTSSWSSGKISTADGTDGSDVNQVRSDGFITPQEKMTVRVVDTNYKYGVWKYSLEGTFISVVAWLTTAMTFDLGFKYRIVITGVSASDISNKIDTVSRAIVLTDGDSDIAKKADKAEVSVLFDYAKSPISMGAKKIVTPKWESGQISISTGENAINPNAIRTIDFITPAEPLTIRVSDYSTYRYLVLKYSMAGNYISHDGYLIEDKIFYPGFKYKLQMSLRADTNIANQISSVSEKMTVYEGVLSKIEDLVEKSKLSQSIDYEKTGFSQNFERLIAVEYEKGSLSTTTGLPLDSTTIVRASGYFTPKGILTLKLKDSDTYKYGIFTYDSNGTLLAHEAWIRSDRKEIPYVAGRKYKVMITRVDGGAIDIVAASSVLTIGDGNIDKEASYYIAPELPITWYVPTLTIGAHNMSTLTAAEVYSGYDALVTANSTYITKTLLGNDQSNTYPIYAYAFKPSEVDAPNLSKTLPKIVLFTGTHGAEKASTMSLLNLMTDICNHWRTNEALEYLRWNVQFVIIPVLSPYAMINNSRGNVNGVDINRNSSYMFHNGEPSSSSPNYRGVSAFSELETQYAKTIIDQHKDAIFMIDYHTFGGEGNVYDRLIYCALTDINPKKDLDIAAKYMVGKMTRIAQKKYEVPTNSGYIGHIEYGSNMPMLMNYASHVGLQGLIVECTEKFPDSLKQMDVKTMTFNTEYIGNFILSLIRKVLY